MANLPESSTFDAGVYQLETTDPVQGGATGITNTPLKNLVNRTRWLYDNLATAVASISGLAPLASPTFTGVPLAPTAALGDSTTKLATTAFVAAATAGVATVNVAGNSNVNLTTAQYGGGIVILTGALTGNINVVFPTQADKWIVVNSTTGAYTVTCKTAGGTGYAVTQGTVKEVACDATNIIDTQTDYANIALTGVPTAPTAAPGTNTSQLANTAFVTAACAALIAGSGYAPIASPTFTGTPAGPTAAGGTNTTQLATTAFVQAACAALSFAPLASPTFTGTPLAPTAGGGTNNTQIATTAFVQAALAAFAPLASPALTGNPTAPTQSAGNNSTRLATTAFVTSADTALFSSVSKAINGYQILPNGLIIQWGQALTTGASQTVNYPISFAGGVYVIAATAISAGTPGLLSTVGGSATYFTLYSSTSGYNVAWIAIGV